ncbi:MAG: hypothetical protein HY821_05745 [Acidobacteria bacterium]|nr:hypothetical protein [Acidobacteriota bacterium]
MRSARGSLGLRISLAACVVLATAPSAQAARNPTIMVTSDGRAGGQLKQSQLDAMQMIAVGNLETELHKKLTCYDILSRYDLAAMLGFAKQRQLLATEGSERDLEQLGIAVKRDYLVIVSVSGVGKKVWFHGRVLDVKKASVVAMYSEDLDNDNKITDGIVQFAKSFVEEIDLPVCRKVWVGTITTSQVVNTDKPSEQVKTGSSSTTCHQITNSKLQGTVTLPLEGQPTAHFDLLYETRRVCDFRNPTCSGHTESGMRRTGQGQGPIEVNVTQDSDRLRIEFRALRSKNGKLSFISEGSGCASAPESLPPQDVEVVWNPPGYSGRVLLEDGTFVDTKTWTVDDETVTVKIDLREEQKVEKR